MIESRYYQSEIKRIYEKIKELKQRNKKDTTETKSKIISHKKRILDYQDYINKSK